MSERDQLPSNEPCPEVVRMVEGLKLCYKYANMGLMRSVEGSTSPAKPSEPPETASFQREKITMEQASTEKLRDAEAESTAVVPLLCDHIVGEKPGINHENQYETFLVSESELRRPQDLTLRRFTIPQPFNFCPKCGAEVRHLWERLMDIDGDHYL